MEQRFLRFVNKTDTCWLWTGHINHGGYGLFHPVDYKTTRSSHRVAYELWNAPIPLGLCVRHKCDVRNCVNPTHLELGTHKDNVKDMYDRNRQANINGTRNPSAKLTEDDVREIRILNGFGFAQKELGKMYDVSASTIGFIINYKRWKHI
jgi:hypothetical protein